MASASGKRKKVLIWTSVLEESSWSFVYATQRRRRRRRKKLNVVVVVVG